MPDLRAGCLPPSHRTRMADQASTLDSISDMICNPYNLSTLMDLRVCSILCPGYRATSWQASAAPGAMT